MSIDVELLRDKNNLGVETNQDLSIKRPNISLHGLIMDAFPHLTLHLNLWGVSIFDSFTILHLVLVIQVCSFHHHNVLIIHKSFFHQCHDDFFPREKNLN